MDPGKGCTPRPPPSAQRPSAARLPAAPLEPGRYPEPPALFPPWGWPCTVAAGLPPPGPPGCWTPRRRQEGAVGRHPRGDAARAHGAAHQPQVCVRACACFSDVCHWRRARAPGIVPARLVPAPMLQPGGRTVFCARGPSSWASAHARGLTSCVALLARLAGRLAAAWRSARRCAGVWASWRRAACAPSARSST